MSRIFSSHWHRWSGIQLSCLLIHSVSKEIHLPRTYIHPANTGVNAHRGIECSWQRKENRFFDLKSQCNLLNMDCTMLLSAGYNLTPPILCFLFPLRALTSPGTPKVSPWIKAFASVPKGASMTKIYPKPTFCTFHQSTDSADFKAAKTQLLSVQFVLLMREFLHLLQATMLQTGIYLLTVTTVDLPQSLLCCNCIH